MSDKGRAISSAVDRFLSTYFAVSEKKAREEDRAEESKYREFYARLQGEANDRAAESHALDLQAADLRIQELTEEAAARQQWFEKTGQSFASWGMMTEQEKFEMAKGSWDMAQELNALQLETGRFQLQHSKAMAPLELQGAQLRNRNAALGGGGRGKAKDPMNALQDQWDMYNQRQKSIEARLDAYKNPLTGETDWERVPPALMKSYEMNSQHMTELEQGLAAGQGAMLGLSNFDEGVIGGPGSSEAADPMEEFLNSRGKGAGATADEQKARSLERARLSDLGNRKAVYVDPNTGTLTATNDAVILENAEKKAKAAGGALELYRTEEVPTWAIGKSVEDWKRYEKAKARTQSGFALGPGGAGMMR